MFASVFRRLRHLVGDAAITGLVGTGVTDVRISDNTFGVNVIRIDGNANVVERNVLPLNTVFGEIRLNGTGNVVRDNVAGRVNVTTFASANQVGAPGHGNTIMHLVNQGDIQLLVQYNTFPGAPPGLSAIALIDTFGLSGSTVFRNTIRGYDLGIHVSAGTGFELSENSIDDTGMAIDLGLTGTLTSAPLTQIPDRAFLRKWRTDNHVCPLVIPRRERTGRIACPPPIHPLRRRARSSSSSRDSAFA